jgi:hypothetical protein
MAEAVAAEISLLFGENSLTLADRPLLALRQINVFSRPVGAVLLGDNLARNQS